MRPGEPAELRPPARGRGCARVKAFYLFALLLPAAPASSQVFKDAAVAEVEPFVVCEAPRGEPVAAPGTEEGSIETGGDIPRNTWTTTEVPLVREVTFGVRARSASETFDPVTITWSHPPFENGTSNQSFENRLYPDGDVYSAYRIERDSEMVAGEWVLTASHAGRELYRVSFILGAAEADPEIARQCAGVPRSE
nr:DUF3859 domain-containing protein [Vannielia litorea]